MKSTGPGVGCGQQSKMPDFQSADLLNWSRVSFSSRTSWQEGVGSRFLKPVFASNNSLGNLLSDKIN